MFGFPKKVLLQRELLQFLDNQETYTTSIHIVNVLPIRSRQTILKYIKELQETIEQLYDKDNLYLELNKRDGVFLHRKNANFQAVFEQIYSDTITYQIYRRLILERCFSVDDFCEKEQISFSKLRRDIKQINDFLMPYELFISIGNTVKITGDEAMIRLIFFLFLYYVHRQVVHISWIDMTKYIKQAQESMQQHAISNTKSLVNKVALWIFIHEQAADELENLHLPTTAITIQGTIEEKFTFTVLDMLDLLDGILQIKPQKVKEIQQWITMFETDFRPLTLEEQQRVYQLAYKKQLLKQWLPNQELITAIFSPTKVAELVPLYPKFAAHLAQFWDRCLANFPEFSEQVDYHQLFLFCLPFVPEKMLLKPIRICLISQLPTYYVQQIQQQLTYAFHRQVELEFVAKERAELYVFTERFTLPQEKPSVLIDSQLSIRDMQQLQEILQGK